MQVATQFSGWLMLGVFFVVCFIPAVYGYSAIKTKSDFLVANRGLKVWESSFSIAATWIWAPALFIASQKAYQQGWVGLFWFTVPNIACLIIFSWFAERFRERLPNGFTLAEFINNKFGRRVKSLYVTELLGLSICSFAVQLLAGGLIFSTLTGISFLQVTLAMSFIALSYSMISGIKGSVRTDHIQYLVILIVSLIAVPTVIFNAGGMSTLIKGLAGRSGEFTHLFSGAGLDVFFSFGIAVTIGLLAGPFGDQSFWQRSLSIEKKSVRKAFLLSAVVFGVIPILLSCLGFVAAGAGLDTDSAQLINLQAVIEFAPAWMIIPFVFMLISGLVSTIDSSLCAIASIVSSDLSKSEESSMKVARFSMAGAALVALVIANIPNMQILYLFLFYGTLRASVLIPTIVSLTAKKVSEPAMFYGILLSICVGLPVFAYGKFNGIVGLIVAGSLITVLTSGIIVSSTAKWRG